MNILIRLEEVKDYRRVEEITRLAFSYQGRIERGQIGCPYEHWMVNELRKRDGVTPVLNFGPISVLPDMQRKGIGKALITNMIEKATQLGYGAILFFGRPEYYPRFGFKEASEFGIADAEGYNYPAFMGMELIPGYLAEATGGRYYESDIYNDELNREAVKAFDKQFGV